jgi:hypothetical protein
MLTAVLRRRQKAKLVARIEFADDPRRIFRRRTSELRRRYPFYGVCGEPELAYRSCQA